jgi:D-amino-acid dehydrogenase
MACGSGHVLADVIGGKRPAIALDGLTLDRFG